MRPGGSPDGELSGKLGSLDIDGAAYNGHGIGAGQLPEAKDARTAQRPFTMPKGSATPTRSQCRATYCLSRFEEPAGPGTSARLLTAVLRIATLGLSRQFLGR